MAETREVLNEAYELEAEAAEAVGAAQAEQHTGKPALSLGLVKEAIDKERRSLDLIEEGIETLRQGLEQRRQALDQQAKLMDQMIGSLSAERTEHAKGR